MRRFVFLLITATILIHEKPSRAGAISLPVKLDPNITRALETGILGASQVGPPGRAKVLIELVESATDEALAALRAAGAELIIVNQRTLAYKRFVPAVLTSASAAAVAALPSVVHISLASAPGPLPLDQSAKLIRLADARGARPALDDLTGKGVLIGDIDAMVDPFHPTFFKGDAGYFDWIDVDKDGRFTPGTDAIDLDQSGTAGPGETAELIAATTVNVLGNPVHARNDSFDPSTDWLYLDTNGNGRRDYGQAAGFDDTVPAFGEPLFVPDDVNRNGQLDPGERVVRLGTSKFRKIYVYINAFGYPVNVDHVYERGVDLAATQINYTNGMLYGFADALHGTGVNTILIGDVPLVGRRWVGIAPEAEVILGFEPISGLPVNTMAWALGEKPNVMLYEFAPWTGYPLDGSDPLSSMIDAATTEDNVTNTCPTGDEGSARKHAHADVAAGATSALHFNVPARSARGLGAPFTFVEISLNVTGGPLTSIVLTEIAGGSGNLLSPPQGQLKSGTFYYLTNQDSPRGTHFVDLMLYTTNGQAIPTVGDCTLQMTANAQQGATVDAYLADDKSSWGLGVAWDPSIATDRTTVGIPSVADHCIAVNAAPDHMGTPDAPWYQLSYAGYDVPSDYTDAQDQIRAYNPRGPRIDGVQKPDITAPDNPWVASEHDDQAHAPPYGSFFVFGGTSGASPHVTGVAALLAQAGIQGDAARDAIRAGAISDAVTGTVPNGDYGYGRLDAAGALGVKDRGSDPHVTVTAKPPRPTTADRISLIPTGDGDNLEAKWDDGYDGSWDTSYAPLGSRAVGRLMPGAHPFKVRVRNHAGHVADAITWVTVTPAAPGCGCRIGGQGAAPAGGRTAALSVLLLLLLRARRRRTSAAYSGRPR